MRINNAELFQKTLAATGCLAAAARAARLTPARARRLRDAAPPPPAPEAAAQNELARAVAALESEAVRRALAGVEIPVFHQGRECGQTTKHSDALLMFLLKTLKPERYAPGRDAASPVPERVIELDIDLCAADE